MQSSLGEVGPATEEQQPAEDNREVFHHPKDQVAEENLKVCSLKLVLGVIDGYE
jgi:hypothetical protein